MPSQAVLPEQTRVGAVRLQVSDLDRSIEYYERVIGLSTLESRDNTASLGVATTGEHLVHLHEKRGVVPVPRRGAFGLFHFAILLPDRADLGRFVVHLAQLHAPAGSADHLVSEALYLSDPDGLGIEVYADRPRDSWRRVGSELQMTTDPLDIEDLVRSADGTAWTGAPAGTTMGHVHLHVADLDAAERFYGDALGFDVTVRGYPGARFFSAGGYHHHLGTNTWSRGPAATDEQARLLEWELLLPQASDIDAVVVRLRDAGYAVDQADASARAADPWGTALRMVARA